MKARCFFWMFNGKCWEIKLKLIRLLNSLFCPPALFLQVIFLRVMLKCTTLRRLPREPLLQGEGRLSTVDLLVLTRVDLLISVTKLLFTFFTKQTTLFMWSTLMSLSRSIRLPCCLLTWFHWAIWNLSVYEPVEAWLGAWLLMWLGTWLGVAWARLGAGLGARLEGVAYRHGSLCGWSHIHINTSFSR